jgi:hypothetical protein
MPPERASRGIADSPFARSDAGAEIWPRAHPLAARKMSAIAGEKGWLLHCGMRGVDRILAVPKLVNLPPFNDFAWCGDKQKDILIQKFVTLYVEPITI